ncbi:MAG: flagellar hook-basal body complex protein FliE [Acidimicrobiales bacterium]
MVLPIIPASAAPVSSARLSAGNASSGTDFGEAISRNIGAVSAAENKADGLVQALATGDPTVQLHDVTVAAAEANLSLQLMVAVRDKAVEAYREIINLQV